MPLRNAGPNLGSMIGATDTRPGSALLRNRRQSLNHFSLKSKKSVHPVTSLDVLTTCENEAAPHSRSYIVKVRVLHGVDLHVSSKTASCQQHAARPIVSIAVDGGSMQSLAAVRHARNHSIWKKHELEFQISDKKQSVAHVSTISMHVSLACLICACLDKTHDKASNPVAIGEVGEIQFTTEQNGDFEISQFFPVVRRQHQSSSILLPAGKIKLCIKIEKVAQPEIPKRLPFALPSNFGETLQMKRKQLNATVKPEDIAQKAYLQVSQVDPEASMKLLREIAVETACVQINASDLKMESRIGEGIHSCVSFGVLLRDNNDSGENVAVKEFRYRHAIPPVNVLRAFYQEIQILKRCRDRNGRQYVVELLGVILEPRLTILMEYCSHGSLAQCLQDEPAWSQMSSKQKAFLGLNIAQGIAWLHKHDMIHRDIKTHNILLSGDLATSPVVKIGDVGSAVVRSQHEPLLLEEVGSSGYTAPEIFMHHGYDSKIDVWSFGVVLWELTSTCPQGRVNPFIGITGDEFVNKAQSGCRPNFMGAHSLCMKPIIEKCWTFDPSLRPSMDEVVNLLEAMCIKMSA